MSDKQALAPTPRDYSEACDSAFEEQFGIKSDTHYNLVTMRRITTRVDEAQFTPEQIAFLRGFESGFLAAQVKP
jgi:hypothetical protein